VFAPPQATPAVWSRGMRRAFDLSWRIELDAVTAGGERGASLDADAPAPEALPLLASDWEQLLRPVRVKRYLPVSASDDAAWLRLDRGDLREREDAGDVDDEAVETRRRGVILAHQRVGSGAVLLLSAPLSPAWTSLPTKPLFVPLVHETLRGVLGAARGRIAPDVVAGDVPGLGRAWRGAARLVREDAGGDREGDASIALQAGDGEDGGVRAVSAVEMPGVYAAANAPGALKLAVNVDAAGGDTRSVSEERVSAWLGRLGGGRLLPDDAPGSALQRASTVLEMGWPLLWVVALLVLLETVMARYMSHARQHGQRTLGGRVWDVVRYLRHEPAASGRSRERGRAA